MTVQDVHFVWTVSCILLVCASYWAGGRNSEVRKIDMAGRKPQYVVPLVRGEYYRRRDDQTGFTHGPDADARLASEYCFQVCGTHVTAEGLEYQDDTQECSDGDIVEHIPVSDMRHPNYVEAAMESAGVTLTDEQTSALLKVLHDPRLPPLCESLLALRGTLEDSDPQSRVRAWFKQRDFPLTLSPSPLAVLLLSEECEGLIELLRDIKGES